MQNVARLYLYTEFGHDDGCSQGLLLSEVTGLDLFWHGVRKTHRGTKQNIDSETLYTIIAFYGQFAVCVSIFSLKKWTSRQEVRETDDLEWFSVIWLSMTFVGAPAWHITYSSIIWKVTVLIWSWSGILNRWLSDDRGPSTKSHLSRLASILADSLCFINLHVCFSSRSFSSVFELSHEKKASLYRWWLVLLKPTQTV